MKNLRFSTRPVIAASILLTGAVNTPMFTPSAWSAPRKLEIWPGQRVLLVLPTTLGSNWNVDPKLGQTILPFTQRELREALVQTRKFSLTTPYRFDPILRRAVVDKRIADSDIDSLLANPSAENAQPILNKLVFEQPIMMLETKLEELRIGGSTKSPTVQLQVSGRLFQGDNGGAAKTVTITSPAVTGSNSVARIEAAASRAFAELAAELIAPPESFELPIPVAQTLAQGSGAINTSVKSPFANRPGASSLGTLPVVVPVAPADIKAASPAPLSPSMGVPFVPQLPPAQPPLGIAINESPGSVR